jgi:hypothetical protein
MDRRRYLATLAAGATFAGCTGLGGDDSGDSTDPDVARVTNERDGPEPSSESTPSGPETTGGDKTVTATSVEAATIPTDYGLPIPRENLHRVVREDAIPAITEPAFARDWSGAGGDDEEFALNDGDRVIGVERGGLTRAYPLRVLNWHEVVNDEMAGPVLVTYCPLCGSGVTAERRVAGEATRFGVSGLLWNSDLVMYDRLTGSLWSQLLGTAIHGPRTGDTLQFIPSNLTTWGAWRESHPETSVLLPPPASETVGEGERGIRSYAENPYVGYDENEAIGVGYNEFEDDRLHPKAIVLGVRHDGRTKAYPLGEIGENTTVNDTVAGLPVVVTTTAEGSMSAFERRVNGEVLVFENAGDRHIRAGGSRWEKLSGRALDDPLEGATLTRANERSELFWFAWVEFFPNTSVYRR